MSGNILVFRKLEKNRPKQLENVLVLVKLQTTLQPSLIIRYLHRFMFYNRTNDLKLQNTPHMCFFAFTGNVIIRFSENKFSQDFSGHHFVKRMSGKRFRKGISECSFCSTIWLFGKIIIDITSVLEVLPVVLEIEREILLLVLVYCMSGPLGTLIDDFILLINELPTRRRILIYGDFNLDQMSPENVAEGDPLFSFSKSD